VRLPRRKTNNTIINGATYFPDIMTSAPERITGVNPPNTRMNAKSGQACSIPMTLGLVVKIDRCVSEHGLIGIRRRRRTDRI